LSPIVLTPQDERRSRIATAAPAFNSRQRTLAQLYVRRATVLNLIQSLQVYERGLSIDEAKVVPLR
jgi:hypothetical protein